jgi:hypothetical protein
MYITYIISTKNIIILIELNILVNNLIKLNNLILH